MVASVALTSFTYVPQFPLILKELGLSLLLYTIAGNN